MTERADATTQALGPFISQHGRSRTGVVPLAVGILFIVFGAALPLLLFSGARMDPAVKPMLLGAAAALVVIGLLMLLAWKLTAPKVLIALHEKGVVVNHVKAGRVEVVRFADMADVYLFRTGGYAGGLVNALAFRRSPEDSWVDVMDNRRDAFALRAAIMEGYTTTRAPLAMHAIDAGQVVRFHVMSNADRLVKRMVGGMLKVESTPLDLSSRGIDVDGKHIPLERIHAIDGAESAGTLKLLDENGVTVYSVHYLSLFSADLFLILVSELIGRRAPAYRNLMAH